MLFCLTANYTPKALDAMAKNPNTNRREAVEKLLTAAGGKLVAMYGTIAEGDHEAGAQCRHSRRAERSSKNPWPRRERHYTSADRERAALSVIPVLSQLVAVLTPNRYRLAELYNAPTTPSERARRRRRYRVL